MHGEHAVEELQLIDWLKDSFSLNENIQSALKEYATQEEERNPLLNAWANVLHSGETTNFFTETGIDKKAKLTLSDLSVWLFHGLQAQKLTTSD